MKQQKDTEELLVSYFQKEKRGAESQRLQERIAQQTSKSTSFNWMRIAMPVAATVLLVLGLSLWTSQPKQKEKNKVPQSEVIYEDDDFIIYVKE